ncbi:MAG: glycosyltransferase family 4 protein [Candidatus Moranbacteria bacterium]|nr:glycosyltransferase family 4 protein [Candidatus Moranbacteria bacterium]
MNAFSKKKIRLIITVLTPAPASHNGKTGGLVRLVEILKRLNDPSGTETILVSSDENYADYFRENGIAIEFKPVKSNLKFKSLFGLCLKSLLIIAKSFFVLKLDFLESKDEKVIAYSSSDLFWEVIPAFYFKIRKKNIKWVQAIHHIYPDWKTRPGNKATNFFGYYSQRFSFWLIKKKADKIISVSDFSKNQLVKAGFPESKINVSSNGIDIEYFESIKKIETAYDGVFLGRLNRSKGIFDLIRIWKKVCDELPQARLAIIGGGREETKKILLKKIRNYNLEKNIDLLGFLEDKKAHQILKSGKVFLFPSHEEGWGIAIAEAMACGLPVVSWNLPVYKEIFGIRTMQIEEKNTNLFSSKVLELLKNDTMRKKIGEDGKEFIKKYSWDSVAKKELEIISS